MMSGNTCKIKDICLNDEVCVGFFDYRIEHSRECSVFFPDRKGDLTEWLLRVVKIGWEEVS